MADSHTMTMTSPVVFLKETRDELKKVTWPKQKDVVRLTATVIVLSLIVGFYVGALDFLFTKVTELLLK